MADMNGTWELESQENTENYFKALGINVAISKAAAVVPVSGQTMKFDVSGDSMTVTEQFYFKKLDITVKFGEETKGEHDGQAGKGTATKVNESEITGVFTLDSGKTVNSSLKIVSGKLVKTDKVDDVEATRTFKKQE